MEPKRTKEAEKEGKDVSTLGFSLFSLFFVSFGYSVFGLRPKAAPRRQGPRKLSNENVLMHASLS